MAARKFFVGGNWKSNGTVSSITSLVNDVLNTSALDTNRVDVVVAPVSLHINLVK